MEKPDEMLFSLQKLVSSLSLIDRNHHVLDSERAENDIDHSFSVALLCWYLCEKHRIPLDLNKVMRYALVHDFVERYAGDVNTYATASERLKKIELEKASLSRLSAEFKGFPGLVAAMQNYEAKSDEEALFVWTVDKMQAMILGDLDNWRPYRKLGITYDKFAEKHSDQLEHSSPYCKVIFAPLLEYCQTTFYDRPAGTRAS